MTRTDKKVGSGVRGEGSENVAKDVRYLELPEGMECDLWCGREKLAELAVCSAALLFGRHQERLPLLSDRHVSVTRLPGCYGDFDGTAASLPH